MTVQAVPDHCELVELPNGSRLFFVEDGHEYWRCKPDGSRGRRLTGVSTVTKPLDWKPDGLMRWAVRLSLEGVVQGFNDELVPKDPFVLQARLRQLGLDWESIRDQAATRGTNVHEQMLHALAMGEDIPDLGDLSEEQRGYGQAVLRWWRDRRPKVLQAEQIVLSEEHGVAGRFDLRCEIEGRPGSTLVDLKTGSFISAGAHAQLAGYQLLAEQSGFGETTTALILQVRDDATYREIPVCATPEDFVSALTVYRSAGRINGAAKKLREAA